MKKILLFMMAALIMVSCKKSGSDENVKPTPDPDPDPTPTYYINFKANGTAVSFTDVSGTRGTTTKPRTLTINGKATDGSKIKFYFTENFIGFTGGLSIGSYKTTYPDYYVEYTNSAGVLYSTKNGDSRVTTGFLGLSYTNGGTADGAIDGTVKTDKGAAVKITDGKFKIKFSN